MNKNICICKKMHSMKKLHTLLYESTIYHSSSSTTSLSRKSRTNYVSWTQGAIRGIMRYECHNPLSQYWFSPYEWISPWNTCLRRSYFSDMPMSWIWHPRGWDSSNLLHHLWSCIRYTLSTTEWITPSANHRTTLTLFMLYFIILILHAYSFC